MSPITLFAITLGTLFVISGFIFPVQAKGLCCFWHGSVCGCSCCDGTPMSERCEKYYPECKGIYVEEKPFYEKGLTELITYYWEWFLIIPLAIGAYFVYKKFIRL